MNKKGIFLFGDMHPGIMFILGLIIGGAVMYFLILKGIVPTNLI